MKYLKYFENKKIPEIGDYILIKYEDQFNDKLNRVSRYHASNVGIVVDYYYEDYKNTIIRGVEIKYDSIPKEFEDYKIVNCPIRKIAAFGKNSNELERKILIKKFNL